MILSEAFQAFWVLVFLFLLPSPSTSSSLETDRKIGCWGNILQLNLPPCGCHSILQRSLHSGREQQEAVCVCWDLHGFVLVPLSCPSPLTGHLASPRICSMVREHHLRPLELLRTWQNTKWISPGCTSSLGASSNSFFSPLKDQSIKVCHWTLPSSTRQALC